MRTLLLVLATGLILAPAATAKTGWEVDRDWESLTPGDRTSVVLTAIDHGDGGPTSRFEGTVPTVEFEQVSTGKKFRFAGSPADSQGHSTVPVTVPEPGGWQITVTVDGQVEGGWPPVHIAAPAKQATPPPASADDSGGPQSGFVIAGVLLVLLAAGAIAAQRRPRMGGA